MSSTRLYSILVPDAPLYRRTDRDVPAAPFGKAEGSFKFNTSFLDSAMKPGLEKPRLISSYNGLIERILFSFPTYGVQDPASVAAYRSVIAALRPGTKFIVIHHEPHRELLETWFADAGHAPDAVTYVSLPDYVRFTDWAEDAYVALRDASEENGEETTYLLEPWEFPRSGDALLADAVEEYAPVRASQAPLIFQGGNCLIGEDFWLLGKDYFADSVELCSGDGPVIIPKSASPDEFVRNLFGTYVDATRKLHLVGTAKQIPLREYYGTHDEGEFFLDIAGGGAGAYQPIFHIDMFITLAGRTGEGPFEVLVGSPRLADEMLGRRSPFSLDDVYDRIANQLEEAGLRVHRNPLVHYPSLGRQFTLGELRAFSTEQGNESLIPAVKELSAAGAQSETTVRVRTWHHITWNNCLVENAGEGARNVYLPTFGHEPHEELRPIDAAMKQLWEELGFTVYLLGNFNSFAERLGVVHCIKKYLQRSSA